MPTVTVADRSVGVRDPETLSVEVPGGRLAAERWAGTGPTLVLLHAGVVDRRAWTETADPPGRRVRRGRVRPARLRREPAEPGPLHPCRGPAGRAGRRRGGPGLAGRQLARAGRSPSTQRWRYPERVAGLVLLAPAISGAADDVEADPETERLDAADRRGRRRPATWTRSTAWRPGSGWTGRPGPEGRVGGPARELFLAMNAIALRSEAESRRGRRQQRDRRVVPAGRDHRAGHGGLGRAGHRGAQRALPGAGRAAARRRPAGRCRNVAHLPYLEDPDLVADLIRDAVAAGG